MRKSQLILLVAATLAAGGCTPTPMYYWGNYSASLYHFRKEANDESRDKHMAELEAIVKGSQEHKLRVPPGVYCELGYMQAKKGKRDEALALFALEKATYPEATHFVDRLVQSINSADQGGKKSVEGETRQERKQEGGHS